MTLRKKPQERLPFLLHPGDPETEWGSPGSIEQELDMCEKGTLRGDDILHSHGMTGSGYESTQPDLEKVFDRVWRMDLSEENREGDEMTGDEHSSGLEGGETELERQSNGLPGDRTRHEEREYQLVEQTEYPEEIEIPKAPPPEESAKVLPFQQRKKSKSKKSDL
jgi:hypothetical protein